MHIHIVDNFYKFDILENFEITTEVPGKNH